MAVAKEEATDMVRQEWEASVVRELNELYQLEVEASKCYDKLEEAQEKNKLLEAKLVEICGDPEVVNSVLVAENRRRRLEFITVSSTKVGEVKMDDESAKKICLFDTNEGGAADEWRKALPLRFRRELELEEAHSEIVEVRTPAQTACPELIVRVCVVCAMRQSVVVTNCCLFVLASKPCEYPEERVQRPVELDSGECEPPERCPKEARVREARVGEQAER